MSYLKKVLRKCLICVLLVLLFASCDLFKTDDPTGPGDDNYNWKYLSTTDYPIESTDGFQINDSISGGIFEFPSGGSGDLTIKRISPPLLLDGITTIFEIQYDKSNKVLFYQKHKEGDVDYFMTFMHDEYVMLNGDTTRWGWYALPVTREENGYYVYDLDSIFDNTNPGGITLLSNKRTIKAIAINYPSDTKIARKPEEFKKAIEEIVDKIIEELPTNLQDEARKKYKDKKFSVVVWNSKFSDNSYNYFGLSTAAYRPFTSFLGRTNCEFYFLDNDLLRSVAHETGHYFHHFSIGNSNYKPIYNKAISNHGLGMRRSRSDLIEEPAYLASVFINPSGLSIQSILNDNDTEKNSLANYPEITDFPSLEGFTSLMCYLPIRNNPYITKFDDTQIAPPEINSITWTEVFKMIYENTNNVNDFRTKIEEILKKNGEENKFLIYLQAMGWNYRVKCRFVDQNNKELSGVEARFISLYKPEEYALNLGLNKTGTDGLYQLNHSYPGKNKIRVYLNNFKDSMDLGPYEIDWKEPTTKMIELGDIVVPTQGPLITNVTPKTCVTNSQVKLTGVNFKEWGELYLNDENIYFNDWKDTEILFKVPSSAKKGINKIYVMVNNVKSNEVELDVQLPVSKLDIEPLVSIINKGASVQLIPKMQDQEGNTVTDRPVTWNSYATNIITFTDKGLVTGLKEGITTVTATTDFAYNKCHVCVSEPDPSLKTSDKIIGFGGLAVEYNISGIGLSEYQGGINRNFSGFPIGSTITLTAKVYGPYSIEGSWSSNAYMRINSAIVEEVRAPDKGGEQGWTHSFKTITITVDENIKKNGLQISCSVGYSRSLNSEGIGVVFNSKPCKQ